MKNHNSLLKQFFAAAKEPTTETVSCVIHEDCVTYQGRATPYAGKYFGAAGFLDLLKAVDNAYILERIDFTELYENASGEIIIVEFAMRGSTRATGVAFETTVMEKWKIKEGKIIEILPCWFEPPLEY